MKIPLIFSILLGITNLANAQFQLINLKEVESIKNSKIVVGLTGNKDLDDAMIAAVNEFWKISEIGEPMPVEEAISKTKEDNSITVIKIGEIRAISMTHKYNNYWNYRNINSSKVIELYNGGKKPVFKQFIPEFNNEITSEILWFGIAAMHYQLVTMEENNIGVTKLKKQYKSSSPKLNDVTLLIPEGWTDKKTTPESLKEIYGGKAYIVSYSIWRKAIMERDEDVAYSIICSVPFGDGYVHLHYLMDAKTGNILAVIQPKVAVSINKPKGNVNLTKGNSGYVNKKILEKYNNVLAGKW